MRFQRAGTRMWRCPLRPQRRDEGSGQRGPCGDGDGAVTAAGTGAPRRLWAGSRGRRCAAPPRSAGCRCGGAVNGRASSQPPPTAAGSGTQRQGASGCRPVPCFCFPVISRAYSWIVPLVAQVVVGIPPSIRQLLFVTQITEVKQTGRSVTTFGGNLV